jgi:hypothetical protein
LTHCQQAVNIFAMRKFETDQPENIATITDAGVDLDDELALILGGFLQREGLINLKAVTANLKPSIERARLVRGTLDMIGYGSDLPDVPVGMGMGNIEKRNGEPHATEQNCSYLADRDRLHIGDEAFVDVLMDSEPQSLTLVLQSGFADAAALAMMHGDLLKDRVKRVVAMSGVKRGENGVLLENGLMVPDSANNNTFNAPAASIFYEWCQKEGVPITITTRQAAYAAQVPFSLFNDILESGNPVGESLASRQFPSIRLLWKRANSPEGSIERGPLPADRDRQWFVNVFCDGEDPGDVGIEDDIVPYMGKFNLYDPLNLVSAVPKLKEHFFEPSSVGVHEVIGISNSETNVKDGAELSDFMRHGIIESCRLGALALKNAVPSKIAKMQTQ